MASAGWSSERVLGLGRIGSAIARRAAALQMNVVYWGRAKKPDASWPYFADLVGSITFFVTSPANRF
jgi:lactate dehydrogenase-like 2-hydroxyacid dehydrogenase